MSVINNYNGDLNTLLKKSNENEQSFIWRIGEAKTNGLIDLTWDEIADLVNAQFRGHDEEFKGESVYRKQYHTSKLFYENVFAEQQEASLPEEVESKLQETLDKVYKEKKKFYDQRREYNKGLVIEARSEHLEEELQKAARSLPSLKKPSLTTSTSDLEGSEAVLFLSDWHYGLVADNIWNEYNPDVFRERLSKLLSDASRYLKRHKPSKLHVVILGDMTAGNLIPSAQVEAAELGCEQLMTASEHIANIISELSQFAKDIDVHSTYGNHGRAVQRYVDSIHANNFERIIPWWLKQRLADMENVRILESDDHEFLMIKACGYNLVAVHGDLDTVKTLGRTASAVFQKKYGVPVHYAVCGHFHHNSSIDDLGTETIIVGSMCGTDSYANSKRLYSTPSQSLMFFNEQDGLECRYNITFS